MPKEIKIVADNASERYLSFSVVKYTPVCLLLNEISHCGYKRHMI